MKSVRRVKTCFSKLFIFCNYSPYLVSMASSLLIYNALKKQLKWLGTKEELPDILSSKLGIDSSDFQVQDNQSNLFGA